VSKIASIQKDYIELLESYLAPLGKDALIDHVDSGERYSSLPYISDILLAYYESLPRDIIDFWKQHSKDLQAEIANQDNLKVCYSGNVSPTDASNLVNKLGLYVDTMLIPDPIFNVTQQLNEVSQRHYYLQQVIRHSLNMMRLKPLLEADLGNPIAVIYPSTKIYDPVFREKIRQAATKDTIRYLNQTFRLELKDSDDPFEVMSKFKSPEDLVKLLAKPENLIPDLVNPTIPEGFKDFYESSKRFYAPPYDRLNAGDGFCGYIFGRLMSFHDHFASCQTFGAEPIYDNENSWKMFSWYLNDVFPQGNILSNEGLVANSIGLKNPQWIGNLPVDKLVEARGNGELEEIRSTLTKGINRMKYSTSEDVDKVALKVQSNLKEAYDDHQSRIKSIEKTLKRKYLLDYPLVIGGSLIGYIPHPAAVAASIPFTLAGWAGLYKDSKKIRDSENKGRIVGMMYDAGK